MNRSYRFQLKTRELVLHFFLATSMVFSLLGGLLSTPTARAQVSDPGTASLTINKTVIGSDQTDFQITLTGPSYPAGQTFDIVAGSTPITGLLSGIYTVTEISPGTGWTTTYNVGAVTTTDQAVVSLASATPVTTFPATAVTGKVFRDFNSDGLISTGLVTDTGAAGVTVTLFGVSGASLATTQTDANGFYTLTPISAGPYRVEFSNLPTAYEPSRHGAQNATSVQFVNSAAEASNVNFGILEPCFYCQANPLLVTPIFQNGDPTLSGSTANSTVLSATRYNGVPGIPLATGAKTGATWGVAYQRSSDTLLTSAYLKRHSGFAAGGISGIYKTENADSAAPNAALYFKLSDLGINVGPELSARGLPNSVNTRNRDIEAFGLVGRQGIGDIDLSEDGSDLFVSNLFQGKVHRINIGNPAKTTVTSSDVIGEWTIPSACSTADPSYIFGLKAYRGKLYVGAVCSAETTQLRSNLQAAVFEVDPISNTISKVLNIPLSQTRGVIRIGVPATGVWYPWKNTWSISGTNPSAPFPIGNIFRESTQYSTTLYYPQPMLSDIEFDVDGDMIVGIRDRFGDQSGYQNYAADLTDTTNYDGSSGGDILRARKCTTDAATWTLESAGGLCGVQGLPSQVNGQGPAGGEYYTGDFFKDIHEETSMGSLALLGGSGEVVMTMVDPVGSYTGGFNWLDNVDGTKRRTAQLYRSGRSNGFGKANGLGDIEVLCDPAPIEIGNRVWSDGNGNGIQDAGEPGLSGLAVTIESAAGTTVVNTGSDGTWYYAATANTEYTITVASPTGYLLTTSNAGGINTNHPISDVRDSDGLAESGIATIHYTTGTAGQSNHSLDVGFTQPVSGVVNITNTAPVLIGNRLWIEDDNDGIATTGNVTPVVGQQVTATASDGTTYVATTDAGGLYTITVPANDTYTVTTGIPAGTVATPILATDGSNPVVNNDRNHDLNGTSVVVTTTNNLSIDFGFFLASPGLALRKYTNGYDADNVTGPYLNQGNEVTWTYIFTNTGNVALTNVTLIDDKLVAQNPLVSGISLAPGEVMSVTRTGVASIGQYENTATVTGTNPTNDNQILTSTNPSHYFGAAPSIAVRKYTNGEDADEITGPQVPVGSVVTWTYIVTNTGNVVLTNVTLVDDKLAGTVTTGVTMQPGEVLTFTKNGIAQVGQYTNTATVDGTYTPPNSGQPDLPGFPTPPTTPQVVTDTNPSHYFGVTEPGTVKLGDFVWRDDNQDGIQDVAEPGVAGVTVTLQLPNGTILTTVTDGTGHYLFANLAPNATYTVTFVLPTGTIVTKQNTPGDDSKDSDANPVTGVVVVNIGGSDDLTIDAGIYSSAPPLLASLGDYVWNDTPDKLPNEQNDTQDSHDKGVANVKVELLDSSGNVISTTTTDSSGHYLFEDLQPGTYSIRFTAPLSYTAFVLANVGADVGIDSDVITTTKTSDALIGETAQINLEAGENDLTWDAGLIQTPTSDDESGEPSADKRVFLPFVSR